MEKIMQGDEYSIPFVIETASGTATPDIFSDLEIVIGNMRKTLSDGQIKYDDTSKRFLFPLTQEETFSLSTAPQKVQLRCKTQNGEVIGQSLGVINVAASISKVVL